MMIERMTVCLFLLFWWREAESRAENGIREIDA